MASKSREYARGDRLSNFKRAATIERIGPEKAWLGMWTKHLVSMLDMIDDIEAGRSNAPLEMWDEKIGDSINYLILLEGLIGERFKNSEPVNDFNPTIHVCRTDKAHKKPHAKSH